MALLSSTFGTNGRWGDYNGAAEHTKYPNTWLIGAHVQLASPTGSNSTGHNSWVMRERDATGVVAYRDVAHRERGVPGARRHSVTWTAAASGGTSPYTYQFWVYNGTTWTIGRSWSALNTWVWVPPAAGSYTIQVWARNAGSARPYDAWLGAGATITGPAC